MRKIISWIFCSILLFLPAGMIIWPQNVTASSGNEYFDYTYRLELSQTQIKVTESFSARVFSQATCKKELPVSVTGGVIKGKVFARLQGKGVEVTLNPGFLMKIDGIPGEVGESFQKEMEIPLVFPANSQPGIYDIFAQTTEAAFKVFGFWFDGADYLPVDPISAGTVECSNSALESNTPVARTTQAVNPNTPTNQPSVVAAGAEITATEEQSQLPQNAWPMIGGVAGGLLIIGLILWQIGFGRRRRS